MSMALADSFEKKIDKDITGRLGISNHSGGLVFQNMNDVMEFAKTMAISGPAIPPYLRNQAGACLAICIQAVEWRMSPYAVANKSYFVNDRVAYESQLIHAVIEQRAPLIGRLKNRFIGEGETRQCIVWANVQGEDAPLEYTSAQFRSILPKNSPLWKTKPDLQLYYNASRDWARMYFPDVILGVYSDDELPNERPTSTVHSRTSSLSELTEKITETIEPERVVEPQVTQFEPHAEPALHPVDLPAYTAAMTALTSQIECNKLHESTFGPDAPFSFTPEQESEGLRIRDERRAAIKRG